MEIRYVKGHYDHKRDQLTLHYMGIFLQLVDNLTQNCISDELIKKKRIGGGTFSYAFSQLCHYFFPTYDQAKYI